MRVKLFWKNAPMRPVRGFLGTKPSAENARYLEAEINAWLAQNPDIKVAEIKQSASGGSFHDSLWLISVWYENVGEAGGA